MGRSLVIVESPAKAKTINKYLGRNYSVKASLGHVKDLPKKVIGIVLPDAGNGKAAKKKGKGKGKASEKTVAVAPNGDNLFEPTYEVIPGKTKVIAELKKAAVGAEAIYLAADPDR